MHFTFLKMYFNPIFAYMKSQKLSLSLFFYGLLLSFFIFHRGSGFAIAQQKPTTEEAFIAMVRFNRLILNKLESPENMAEFTPANELKPDPLSVVENNIARNLESRWTWSEYTLEMIYSYSTFLFRTKKSQ